MLILPVKERHSNRAGRFAGKGKSKQMTNLALADHSETKLK